MWKAVAYALTGVIGCSARSGCVGNGGREALGFQAAPTSASRLTTLVSSRPLRLGGQLRMNEVYFGSRSARCERIAALLMRLSVGVEGCQNQPLLMVCPCIPAWVLPAGDVMPSGSSKKIASLRKGSDSPPMSIMTQSGWSCFTSERIRW